MSEVSLKGKPRWVQDGIPDPPMVGFSKEICNLSGCNGKYFCKRMCAMHYARVKTYGRTGPAETYGVKRDNDGWVLRNGYKTKPLTGQKKLIYQHREVMENFLGRKLESFENVHHINGNRGDNRIENLELWVVTQPAGQRVEDLIDWICEQYPEQVSAKLESDHNL